MIVKPYKQAQRLGSPLDRAGAAAEKQMAHYLNRYFRESPDICVLNQLRIEDPDQPEQDGSAGVCQVDHLLVHRWGFFLIESKSVTEEVLVRPDGDGGDEWSRTYRGAVKGMPSPIQQVSRQREFLRNILQRHRAELLGRSPFGERTIAKIHHGTDQRGFLHAPLQVVIAISDGGRIRRLEGWKPPKKPFRVIVAKADSVPDKIGVELDRHRIGAKLLHVQPVGDYGVWRMTVEEIPRVAEFLAGRHRDRRADSSVPAEDRDAVHRSREHGFDEIRKRHPNAYRTWTTRDERELCRLHESGLSIERLAARFGRQPSAIESKLRKLGLGSG